MFSKADQVRRKKKPKSDDRAEYEAATERAGGRCESCGKRATLERHHKIKRSQGGKTTRENLAVICRSCHGAEHGITVL